MSLTASMWTGVSGLLVHGEKMNVIGHNIANVNTIGFKSQRMDFQDLFYNNTFSAAGLEQIGMGARVGTVLTDFSQGPFEQTGLSTDLAISGKGWFQVRVPGQDTVYYTRAGDFSFNKQGELKNPQNYILQGWKVPIDQGPSVGMGITPQDVTKSAIIGTGVPVDVKLDTWTVLPKETSKIQTYVQLAAATPDKAHWDSNPFAALFNTWDGQIVDPNTKQPINRQDRPYLAEDAFGYQSPIKIFDDAGVAHTATIYFDKVDKDFNSLGTTYYDGGKPSQTVWEYIVTINPAEDMRMYWEDGDINPRSIQETKMAGILMTGTMTFGSNGDLMDLTSYTLKGGMEAVNIDNGTGNATLLTGYKARWTDPADSNNYMDFNSGDTITAVQMANTAFYPTVNTSSLIASSPTAALADFYTVNGGTTGMLVKGDDGKLYTAGQAMPVGVSPSLAWNVQSTLPTATAHATTLTDRVNTGYEVLVVGGTNTLYAPGATIPAGTNPTHSFDVSRQLMQGTPQWNAALDNSTTPPTVNSGYMVKGASGTVYTPGQPLTAADAAAATSYAYQYSNAVTHGTAITSTVNTPATAGNEYVLIDNTGKIYNTTTPPTSMPYGTTILNYYEVTPVSPATGAATVGQKVKPGFQVTGADGKVYTSGMALPAAALPVAAASQIIGAQNTLMDWYPSAVSNNGLPLMVANFTAVDQAHTVGSPKGKEHFIEMDFGIKATNLTLPWVNSYPLGLSRTAGGAFAPDAALIDPNNPTTWGSYSGLAGMNGTPVLVAEHTKMVGSSTSATTISQQNGYTFGNLMDVVFDQYGVMSGIYSNGVTLPLYQIVLYDFVAPQSLRFEGGNLVSQTRESGDPSWGAAGTSGFGTINGYMIEQSNVDLAKEMVQMITTQRGFQSNSKVITTTDTMLETVVNMKR